MKNIPDMIFAITISNIETPSPLKIIKNRYISDKNLKQKKRIKKLKNILK